MSDLTDSPRPDTAPLCLVTGSASGIGLALTRRLLALGWQVLGLDRQAVPDDLGGGYMHRRCDLTDVGTATEAAIARALGDRPVQAFVHSAGLVRSGGAFDTRPEDALLLHRLHLEAPMRLMALLRARLQPGARVVLVASRGLLGRPNRAPYAATKAAQVGLARSWASELVTQGITVNVVAPGATDTPQLSDPDRGAPPRIDLPLGRLVRPEEVAGTIAFLLGPDAGAITGQTLFICGGASLGISHAP